MKNADRPAYPISKVDALSHSSHDLCGMTKREAFALQIFSQIVYKPLENKIFSERFYANKALVAADALLKEFDEEE